MRIVLQSRTTLFTVPGGDTIQVLKTAEYLKRLGVDATISVDLTPPLAGVDVVHVFNATRPQDVYVQMLNARRSDVPIALSPIYLDLREFDIAGASIGRTVAARLAGPWTIEYGKIAARALRNGEFHRGTAVVLMRGYRSLVRRICRMADVVLPNSRSELHRLERAVGRLTQPTFIVPNGVDRHLFDGDHEHQRRTMVLCVARIEPLKNQLRLIRAVNELSLPTLLIGEPAPNHSRYADRLRREAGANVQFAGRIAHEDLPSFYRRARVHVLASWMETTGLSSLEAGISGCNLVVTDRGDTREYFHDLAHYCDPRSVSSIREAVCRAWEARPDTRLRDRIRDLFTWERCADITHMAYQTATRERK